MASFQSTVLIIATIILIIVLVIIGYMLRQGNATQVWPPILGDCPDYWIDTSGNGANCVNVKNLGTCVPTSGKGLQAVDFTQSTYTGTSGLCNKYTWATGCNVSWDGITYGVPNPCNAPTTTTTTS